MFKTPALRIQQKGVTQYVTAAPLRELRKHCRVDYYRPDNPKGYQRPLVDRRLAEVAKYVTDEAGVLPTSILVCAREEDPIKVAFEEQGNIDGFAVWGMLTVPDGAVLWLVDGQHRFHGVDRAFVRDGDVGLDDYPFPVTVMTGVDQYGEMRHFNIVNTTQRKMPTDIADRHLVMQAEREGLTLIAGKQSGEKQYFRAKATRIVDRLNEETGPWYHQIAIPGVPGRDSGLFRQHGMVVSLESSLKDSFLKTLNDDESAKLLGHYWRALNTVWPEAFDTPGEYRVQATVGVYSLHSVFPSVVQVCLAEHELSEKKMADIWGATGLTSEFWHKQMGDPLTLGTGMASIRALAQSITEALPKAPAVKII
jgi:DGQHR domain-containing protein